MVSEKQIEAYLVRKVREAGGLCFKWTGIVGAPDRIVIYGSVVRFVELKAVGGRVSPIQALIHAKIRSQGVSVEVINTRKGVDEFVAAMLRR